MASASLMALVAGLMVACSDNPAPAMDAGTFAEATIDAPSDPVDAGADALPSSDAHGDVAPGTLDAADGLSDAALANDAALASDTADATNASDAATVDPYPAIMMNYRSWRALADKPYDISAEIFGLCRLPSSAENQFTTSVHTRYGLLDWVNPTAALTIDAATPSHFAAGSVIVKEKYASRDGGAPTVAALGIMLKQNAGFNPAHGDWEFAYWDEAQGLRKDSTGSCASCHDSSSAVDYVFIDDHWRRSDAGL